MRVIFHIDIDAFFASVEELLNDKLKFVPFAVAGKNKHTVISTTNYLARKVGIFSAMNVLDAIKKYPKIILVEPKYEWYEYYSELFFNTIKDNLTSRIEKISIDECFIDVTNLVKNGHNNPILYATQVQKLIKLKTGLSVSIGISYTKFLAKMATNLKKPYAINTLFENEIKEKMWNLDVNKLLYVGKKTVPILKGLGIHKIGDFLKQKNVEKLKNYLGNNYNKIIEEITGQTSNYVDSNMHMPKQIGKSYRFVNFETSFEIVEAQLFETIDSLYYHLKSLDVKYQTITVHFKDVKNRTFRKSKTAVFYTIEDIKNLSSQLLEEILDNHFVKLIGVAFSNPKPNSNQLNLFNIN